MDSSDLQNIFLVSVENLCNSKIHQATKGLQLEILIPYEHDERTKQFVVEAEILDLSNKQTLIRYSITGPLNLIAWPTPENQNFRKDNLWQHTCLEAFFSDSKNPEAPYLEINVSPSGNWNLYNFKSYRTKADQDCAGSVTIKRTNSEQAAQFQVETSVLDKTSIPTAYYSLAVILEFQDGSKSYWTLRHAPEKPDFHNKETWKSKLTP